ncbi:hypothetical protein QYE76_007959 [Lolium multiflorum]|uniref:FAD-binding domain-containing protein n=1 Tax=Lolium multiflorum TaxID=4521 RepID=A0AAD8PHT8_LOLMU|nr:hypothetical protein QYE76_007959 [Lolium multiflorum]
MQQQEESGEDIVIVGAGLAGLAVALGLYRKGVRSVVLESSPALRASGFAFATWPNAFRALDALGVGDKIRKLHVQAEALRVASSSTGTVAREVDFSGKQGGAPFEFRCVRRDVLLQVLEAELPRGTIRYSSKIVSIDQQHDDSKIVHLADGSTLRAKALIGCDGINSVVSRWLGLAKPSYSGRSATRGLAHYPDGHSVQSKFLQFFGHGFRFGYVPCNANDVYWFYTWTPSPDDDGVDKSGAKMKQYVLTKLRSSKVPPEALELVQSSEISEDAPAAPLRFRSPFSLLFAKISKGNVCVAGDALHPMTPDLGQGGCAALEDGVVLARCLGEAILGGGDSAGGVAEKKRIESGLRKYAGIRRWRSIDLVGTAYVVGFLQQSSNTIVSFLRQKFLSAMLARRLVKMSNYDLGSMQQDESAAEAEHIVVVGAGPAGLAVSLGLHRKGVRSLVLESSPALRASGYAITTWRNAFRALDALGVGDKIRKLHLHVQGLRVFSSSTGEIAHELDFTAQENGGPHETCRVRRDLLLRAMEEELPPGTIRYSSKIVSIQEDVGSGAKLIHLADGSVLRAKVLIGCDGVNSVVAKWLGLAKPSYSGRLATRGLAHYPDGHGFQSEFLQFIGQGFRLGFVPCDETDVYWFYTWRPSQNG